MINEQCPRSEYTSRGHCSLIIIDYSLPQTVPLLCVRQKEIINRKGMMAAVMTLAVSKKNILGREKF